MPNQPTNARPTRTTVTGPLPEPAAPVTREQFFEDLKKATSRRGRESAQREQKK